jgi:hypothetical protein
MDRQMDRQVGRHCENMLFTFMVCKDATIPGVLLNNQRFLAVQQLVIHVSVAMAIIATGSYVL